MMLTEYRQLIIEMNEEDGYWILFYIRCVLLSLCGLCVNWPYIYAYVYVVT